MHPTRASPHSLIKMRSGRRCSQTLPPPCLQKPGSRYVEFALCLSCWRIIVLCIFRIFFVHVLINFFLWFISADFCSFMLAYRFKFCLFNTLFLVVKERPISFFASPCVTFSEDSPAFLF